MKKLFYPVTSGVLLLIVIALVTMYMKSGADLAKLNGDLSSCQTSLSVEKDISKKSMDDTNTCTYLGNNVNNLFQSLSKLIADYDSLVADNCVYSKASSFEYEYGMLVQRYKQILIDYYNLFPSNKGL
jgi:hypothetical protein